MVRKKRRKPSKLEYRLAIICSGILIGLIGILVKMIGDKIPITSLNFFRMLFALIFAAAVVPFIDKNVFKPSKQDLKDYAVVGFLMASAFSLYALALLNAPVANVALITSGYIVLVPIFALFILKEKIQKNVAIAIPVALLGVWILNPFTTTYAKGNIIAFIQSAIFALFIIYLRREEKTETLGSVFWFFFFATIFLSPGLLVYGIGDLISVLPLILILGILSTGLAYLLLAHGLEGVSANTGAILTLVTFPLSSIIFAYLFINESASINTLIGGSLLVVASFITLVEFKHKKHFLLH